MPAFRKGVLDGHVLNHAADMALIIQREFHAETLVLHVIVPDFFVIARLFEFFIPILQTGKIERLTLIGEIDDLHGSASLL
ncbi:hypothetical protein HUU39_03390 [candidate division KSB1 bacterium]|nr:hypothetical protein [bacterium]NUM64307.1 hypothetical protein [candidate division KSB1 bacterium]